MSAKEKLNAALALVRADLREEFLKDLVVRLAGSLDTLENFRAEYAECITQALESVDVSRTQAVR